MPKIKRRGAAVLFGVYAILMFWLLFGQRIGAVAYTEYGSALAANCNLIPLATAAEMFTLLISRQAFSFALINLAGNVIMFIPLGYLLPIIWAKFRSWKHILRCGILIVLCVEVLQFVTLLGRFDIDDLWMNVLGIMIGYGLYCGVSAWKTIFWERS